MKKIIILIIIATIVACNNNIQVITITGHVDDSTISVAKLSMEDTVFADSLIHGDFKFVINSTKGNYLNLKLKKETLLYANPGDSLFLDFSDLLSPVISGIGFAKSSYLLQKKIKAEELGIADPRMVDIDAIKADTESYLAKSDSIRMVQIELLEHFIKKHPDLDKLFTERERKRIDYQWMKQKFEYPEFHELFAKEEAKLPKDYYTFTDKIDFNDSILLQFAEYQSCIKGELAMLTKDLAEEDLSLALNAKYNMCKEIINSEKITETICFQLLRQHIIFNGIDNIDTSYKDYLKEYKKEDYKKELKRQYDAWKNLKNGYQAPEFELIDNRGRLVKLSNFIGKLVYIDCWSTKCGKCIAEMPKMKQLVDELNEKKGILFLTIASDADKNKWKSKLKDFSIDAIHLCTGENYGKFNIDYNVKAMPRYILIGKDGKFIDALAKNPSGIKKKLIELLNQDLI